MYVECPYVFIWIYHIWITYKDHITPHFPLKYPVRDVISVLISSVLNEVSCTYAFSCWTVFSIKNINTLIGCAYVEWKDTLLFVLLKGIHNIMALYQNNLLIQILSFLEIFMIGNN